jgi:glycosyltransferase involved in cell wall biosynthesis
MLHAKTTPSSSSGLRSVSAPDVALVGTYPDSGTLHSGRSGVASYTANLARALADAGARVVVVADWRPGQPHVDDDDRVMVLRCFQRGVGALATARTAALRSGAPLVHVQHEHFLYGGPLAMPGVMAALARFPSRLVVTMHQVVDPEHVDGEFTRRHRVRVPSAMARTALSSVQASVARGADAVIVHEPEFAPLVPGSVVIPHGIEVVRRADRGLARRALSLDDELVALCFGYLAPYKGLETAIAAAEHAGPAVRIVIAGGEHPRLAGRDRYAAQLRVSAPESVRFTGYVPEPDVALWFSAADVAVLPHHAPFSSSGSLALALGYGTPALVSSELGRCAEVPSTMTVERDPEVLGSRLRRLALDSQKRQRLHDATLAYAQDRTWPEVARRHLALYEEVIDGDRARSGRVRATQSR